MRRCGRLSATLRSWATRGSLSWGPAHQSRHCALSAIQPCHAAAQGLAATQATQRLEAPTAAGCCPAHPAPGGPCGAAPRSFLGWERGRREALGKQTRTWLPAKRVRCMHAQWMLHACMRARMHARSAHAIAAMATGFYKYASKVCMNRVLHGLCTCALVPLDAVQHVGVQEPRTSSGQQDRLKQVDCCLD